MIKAILFDFYGVICSDDYWQKVKRDSATAGRGEEVGQLGRAVNLGQIDWPQYLKRVARDLGQPESVVEENYVKGRINRELTALAESLRRQGYQVVLASNASRQQLLRIFENNGLHALFEQLFISSDIGAVKPQAEFYEYIITSLGHRPEEMVMIDDLEHNIEGAHACGLKAILYKTPDQLKRDLSAYLD